ncbi:Arginine N-methyltransferase 2 [Entomophthora muscae]|uniref:Arginine N-methyltransferase 2 n=1 Tax=Entomophthora muscae TaxID=34485 RepID=A0ACC2TQF8_9FUNG|nr:Arginine N-methyltransferase 2 [Entomophthora muscae]
MDESSYSSLEAEFGQKFHFACCDKQIDLALDLVKECPDLVWFRDPISGESPLHWSASTGNEALVQAMFDNRHPWNVLDKNGASAGEFAEKEGYVSIYNMILEEGVRAELILELLEQAQGLPEEVKDESPFSTTKEPSNKDYLGMDLKYSEDKLLDAEGNGKLLHLKKNLHVLNIGFGLGLIDNELQLRKPASHTIVEAHPDVYSHMLETGWGSKPGVRIIFGRWQDNMDAISDRCYDGIFFDTFGEYYRDMKEFHEQVPNMLSDDGTYSFFNGLGGDVKLFHDVYCRIAQLHLADLNIETTFSQITIDPSSAKIWDGVKRRYWQLQLYHLPTCKFISQ